MTPPDTPGALAHLAQAARLLDAAVHELGAAIEAGLPAYMMGPARYLSAEAKVCRRRLQNLRKVLTGRQPE
jgi:hypothetical protein